jgi:hypothetical protein
VSDGGDDDQGDLFEEFKRSYYNTTHSHGEELRDYEDLARRQEYRILLFFRGGERYAPSEIHKAVLPEAPLTSCRRGITNLTQRRFLRKTDEQRIGPFGRPEYLWELDPESGW